MANTENKSKWVRIYSKGGVVVNYQGQTGTSRPVVVSTDLLKKFIERGAVVEEIKEDESTVLLTLDNVDADNGGKPVTEEYKSAANIEEEHEKQIEDAKKARTEEQTKIIADEIKAKSEVKLKIASVAAVTDKTVLVNSTINAAYLPNSLEATLSDNKKEFVDILWDTTKLDLTKEGTYALEGTIVPPKGVKNSDNVKAACNVKVVTLVPQPTKNTTPAKPAAAPKRAARALKTKTKED